MNMQKSILFCIILAVLCTLTLFSCKLPEQYRTDVLVQKGMYSVADLQDSEIVDLKGEWIFVPNRFIDPQKDIFRYNRFEEIHNRWTTYTDPMPVKSYASYAIKITGFNPTAMYALKLTDCSSACTVYLDGEAFFGWGIPAETADREVLDMGSQVVVLPLKGKTEAVIVFHVSNFTDRDPGFSGPIQLGYYETLYEAHNRTVIKATFLIGILTLLSVFYLSLFIFYPKQRLALYFSMLNLSFGLRAACYDEFLLTTILPFTNAVIMHKIGYLTLASAIIFLSAFVHVLLNKKHPLILCAILSPAFLYTLIIIFTPIPIYSSLLLYMQIYVLLTALYDVALLTHGVIHRKKYALLFLLAILLFLLLAIWDILISHGIIKGVFVAQFGTLALLIPMSMIVLKRVKLTFETVSDMTHKIEAINTSLARFLPNEFMEFLQKQHTDIKLGDHELEKLHIAFVYLNVHADLGLETERLSVLKTYNEILPVIAPVIKAHHGFIDKYVPEGLMVIFHGTAEEALHCLLETEHFIRKENIKRSAQNIKEITFACGIHYGQILLGTIGEPIRMDNTVISDAVNVASRLQSYALEHKIKLLASEAVKKNYTASLSEPIDFTYSGLVTLPGKDRPVSVYEVHNE